MDKIRELLGKPIAMLVIGFIVGVIIGLPVLGWGLFPVQWTNAAPNDLRQDLKQDWLRMSVDSYIRNHDKDLAASRYQELGPDASNILSTLATDPKVNQQDLQKFSQAVVGTTVQIGTSQPQVNTPQPEVSSTKPAKQTKATKQPTSKPGAKETAVPTFPVAIFNTTTTPEASSTPAIAKPSSINPIVLLVVFCVLALVIGGALVYVLLLRKRVSKNGPTPATQAQELNRNVPKTDFSAEGQAPPVAQFMTTYMQGDDLYDDSFSIDSPSGEFLGECGVGISDTVGVGDPKKVTAFEVWLFDKNDIQTVTKVLMSEHAFNDQNIRQRLASKGEPVLIEAGKHLLLETATLQLEARVVDMNYGQGALPENSFFERLTLELAVWPKSK
ncbi:MAG: hypothetical protein P4L50_20585 [Anaerolineaceae bacterium]|nr:hypothetical protein [Anaerolineaceae bacterium]